MNRMGFINSVSGATSPAMHVQRALLGQGLENGLRAWYLRSCREHIDPAEHGYFERRREARRWFKELCSNQHFQHVVAAFRSEEEEALSRTISLVGWLKDAQRTVNNRIIPYKSSGRLSQLDKLNADGGLREPLFPELDKRLPLAISRRSTTIAGLSDFLGVPSTPKEVVAALHRHAQAAVVPAKPRGAVEITSLLQSWEAPNRRG